MNGRRAVALICLLAATAARPAAALPVGVVYGFDMDQISTPTYTEPGLVSVNQLDPAQDPPFSGPDAGYPAGERPLHDFRILPISDPVASTDLWADAHWLSNGEDATLRISGIAPGSYTLMLLSHQPMLGVAQETAFWIDGSDTSAGSVVNVPNSLDLFAEQTLSLPVTIGESQMIEIRFAPVGTSNFGVLNGVLFLVPEPTPTFLLGWSLGGLAGARGAWRRRAAQPAGSYGRSSRI